MSKKCIVKYDAHLTQDTLYYTEDGENTKVFNTVKEATKIAHRLSNAGHTSVKILTEFKEVSILTAFHSYCNGCFGSEILDVYETFERGKEELDKQYKYYLKESYPRPKYFPDGMGFYVGNNVIYHLFKRIIKQ